MMKQIDLAAQPVRLLGFGVSNADDDEGKPAGSQLELFLPAPSGAATSNRLKISLLKDN
jgi:hypothetical protein